jgi:GNAT superfamily N-acetyltransferase
MTRAVEVARTEGARALFFGALAETFYRRLHLYERELTSPGPPAAFDGELSFGWVDEDSVPEYERLRPGGASKARARLRAGHRCFGTWLDGGLVAVRWVATGSPQVEYLELSLTLEDGAVYHYDSFTSPSHRRRGLSAASQAALAAALAAEGRTRIVRAVLPENRAAVRDAEKAGYRRCGRIGFIRIGCLRRDVRSGLPQLRP